MSILLSSIQGGSRLAEGARASTSYVLDYQCRQSVERSSFSSTRREKLPYEHQAATQKLQSRQKVVRGELSAVVLSLEVPVLLAISLQR